MGLVLRIVRLVAGRRIPLLVAAARLGGSLAYGLVDKDKAAGNRHPRRWGSGDRSSYDSARGFRGSAAGSSPYTGRGGAHRGDRGGTRSPGTARGRVGRARHRIRCAESRFREGLRSGPEPG